ncbi:MAG: sporulation initiation factor Spo0A C-terminal domain-containing protein [Oscillospiraceae bacterium]|nr:sporulation initiation factor Spo0A C-terminal domain-containing protein [Oscillospiraceae bacterium]
MSYAEIYSAENEVSVTNCPARSQLKLLCDPIGSVCLSGNKEAVDMCYIPPKPDEGGSGYIECKIERKLLDLGIPPHVKGFLYIREAVKMLLENEGKIFGITKILYPDIAKLHNTTSTRVERAIRHSIELSWSRGADISKIFGSGMGNKPSNAEFLAFLSRTISLELFS